MSALPSPPPGAGESWSDYYDAMQGKPPRETLVTALARWGDRRPGFAVDLGCGEGRDAVPLLAAGWRVLAIDRTPEALERLRARAAAEVPGSDERLSVQAEPFETADWPDCDLINASFALFLADAGRFPALWTRIARRLRPGGLFAGQLMGPRDSWVGDGVTWHNRGALAVLLAPFDTLWRRDEVGASTTAVGAMKHWHLYHLVARRRGEPTAGDARGSR